MGARVRNSLKEHVNEVFRKLFLLADSEKSRVIDGADLGNVNLAM
jgi:hypothetical protein